jgi:hypothetical protein
VSFPIAGIKIALSTSFGTLLAGLLVGYLDARIVCARDGTLV